MLWKLLWKMNHFPMTSDSSKVVITDCILFTMVKIIPLVLYLLFFCVTFIPDPTCHQFIVHLSSKRQWLYQDMSSSFIPVLLLQSRLKTGLDLFSGRWCTLTVTFNGMRVFCQQCKVTMLVHHISMTCFLSLNSDSVLAVISSLYRYWHRFEFNLSQH